MSSTAFDDQFTAGTQTAEPVRQPYDIVSILQRNVADLEIALKRQTERAEAAESELLAIREDNHSMMLEIHSLRIERAAPDCQTCANRGRVNGLSQESYCDGCIWQGMSFRKNHFVLAVKRRCEACAILPCSCK